MIVVGCGALNNWAWTERFLNSVRSEEHNVHIVVIDQASDAATKAALHAYEHPLGYRVTKQFNPANTGCSGAWNAIIEHAIISRDANPPSPNMSDDCRHDFDPVLICGNDVELRPHTIDALMKAHERSGLEIVSGCETTAFSVPPCMEVGRINFNAFLLGERLLQSIGRFDEQYQPIYFEDNDYHWRLLEAGFEGCVVNDAVFAHGGSMTLKTGGIQSQVATTFEENKKRWQKKFNCDDVNALHVARSRRRPIGTMDEILAAHALRRWERYARLCRTPSDINEHLPTLLRLAYECDHVTEMGVRWATSTTALLHAQPSILECYDVYRDAQVDELFGSVSPIKLPGSRPQLEYESGMTGWTFMTFHLEDVLTSNIQKTDMLFIDTRHTYAQLKAELERHSSKVRKLLVFHDTTLFGERGEDGGPGLKPAIHEFLASHNEWRIEQEFTNNNGLLVLRKTSPAV